MLLDNYNFRFNTSNNQFEINMGAENWVAVPIEPSAIESGDATDGQVLTADGTGGASFEDAGGSAGFPLSGTGVDITNPTSGELDLTATTGVIVQSAEFAHIITTSAASASGGLVLSEAAVGSEAEGLLDMRSTHSGFLPPRMTTSNRDNNLTPVAGLMIYNTTTNKLNLYNGTTWEVVTSA